MIERPSVSIVGAGRVGQALGRLLADAGYRIDDVVCRRTSTARSAAAFIGAGRPSRMAALRAIGGDVVIVATPDDAIRGVAELLAALDARLVDRVVLHASGARGADELAPLRAKGAAVGSMHPLQSFPTPKIGVERFPGSVVALEGDARAVRVARKLALAIGGRPVRVRAGAKALYHAAAVLASGGVTALIDTSLGAMRAAGLTEKEARAAVLPLVEGTVANIVATSTEASLTGPFARGDARTIALNRAALASIDPVMVAVYDLLGERSRSLRERARR